MTESRLVDRLHLLGVLGSNKVMAGELARLTRRAFSAERANQLLTVPPAKDGPGGLLYPFAADLAALCVCYHRTSARVLWDLAVSSATRLEPLYKDLVAALSADERPWLRAGTISVLAFGVGEMQAGERQLVGTVKNALMEVARQRNIELVLDADRPQMVFHVRSYKSGEQSGGIVLSLDLAGRPMHQRGYRTMSGLAPLREDLAANLLMLARYNPRVDVLVDPLAGVGTLGIEGALMAAGKKVWMSGRVPAATDIEPIASEMSQFSGPLFGDTSAELHLCELDPATFDLLHRSLETAGVAGQASTFEGDFRDWPAVPQLAGRGSGLILTNPPYGARLGMSRSDLCRLYQDLGDWCRQFVGYRAGFIVGSADGARGEGPPAQLFLENFGGRPRIKKPIKNGPLSAQFLLYDL